MIPFTVYGGAAAARLILIDIVKREDLIGVLSPNDVVLKIEDVQVSGMLRSEVTRLIEKLCNENDQLAVEIVPAECQPHHQCVLFYLVSLCEVLNSSFDESNMSIFASSTYLKSCGSQTDVHHNSFLAML
ncbi:hypothetical protein DICVIV_10096 [Dictyocaulus viviparus]|uniref:PDZ domain-containing protein n=1 Tax=Dictyocaulus viviparus TaxID=29172 RepID=A0A0D8XH16_DICVI|nr:hypothetical protein DICVIV_10096 [Dictyocaulus viviparus]